MKVKTSELTGPALDWAVAIAKGVQPEDIQLPWKALISGISAFTGSCETGKASLLVIL